MSPRKYAIWQIALLDHLLATIRTVWMEAACPRVKAKAWANIDVVLDKRLELMRQRDAYPESPATTT
ncbi:MAG: hypothetical protein H7067_07560 [Burkholderiales bacterium]|nr:hypothetical protein [Opitutaceae bacterium]